MTRPAGHSRALAALVLPFPLLLASCGGPTAGTGGMRMPPMPVEVTKVEARRTRDSFTALGSIDAALRVEVVSELDGVVRELPFAEGRALAAGDLIAVLDDEEIAAEAARAKALADQAESNYERSVRLRQEDTISDQEMERVETEMRVAEANQALAEARHAKTRVRAPFSGMAGRRRVSPGAFVRKGDVLTELGRLDLLRVSFAAPERFAGRLKPGMRVEVRSPAFPGESFAGRIVVVDPILDPDSRTVPLVAEVPNPRARLKPGMSADVLVVLAEREGALSVPDEAVFAEGAQSFVFVVDPDSFSVKRTAVVLGTREADRVEVRSGLSAGDLVVRAGHQKLFDGARVQPVPDEAPAGETPGQQPPGGGA
jgi:membrane fusion protein (multidrug efflux system)